MLACCGRIQVATKGLTMNSMLWCRRWLALVPVLVLFAILLGGCGGSSKPSYCSTVSDLKQSVSDLGNIKVIQNGTSSVTSAVDKVKSSADVAVNAAKKDFPTETSALSSSIDTLANSVKKLANGDRSVITSLPTQISAVTNSVSSFSNATSSKCK